MNRYCIRMYRPLTIVTLLFTVSIVSAQPVLIVTTDIGQDPDDQQSLVRLLHYADKFQIAGIIANADANYKNEPPVLRDEVIYEAINAYELSLANFRLHSPAFPDADYLRSVVRKGCAGNGRDVPVANYIGAGMDTDGSEWIIEVVDKSADVPVIISVWGGACDLAQALWKVKATRTGSETEKFVSRLRVYFIGKQDSSNEWIIENFPSMWLILALAHNGNSWESTYRGMFLGGELALTSRSWLQKYVLGKTPLASSYPDKAYTGKAGQNPNGAMKEGDSPALLFFIENGLNAPANPEWGGWGGRYEPVRKVFFRDTPDSVFDRSLSEYVSSTQASVYRWRPDFQNDFAARVQWGAANRYKDANHYPVVSVTGPGVAAPTEVAASAGDLLRFDASGSSDPDGGKLSFEWFFYPEAGDFRGIRAVPINGNATPKATFKLPMHSSGKTVHLILRVTDHHETPLTSYKRIIIRVRP